MPTPFHAHVGAILKSEETPIAKKIEEQSEFVGWWEETVTPNKGGDRGNQYVEAKFQVGNFGRDSTGTL